MATHGTGMHKDGVPMKKKPQNNPPFNGFAQANTTPVPDVLFDELLSILSGTELKVLLYIIRRTRGFKKDSDAISLNQFQHGIVTKDGKRLDSGCGVSDRTAIVKALKSLETKKCIFSEKSKTDEGDNATTLYRVFFTQEVVEKSDQGSGKNLLPRSGKIRPGGVVGKSGLPVVENTHPQETVIQQTDNIPNGIATDVASPTDPLSSLPDQALVDEIHRREQEKFMNASLTANPATEKSVESKATRNTSSKPRNPRVRVTEPLQKPLPKLEEPTMSDEARAVWNVWIDMPWNKAIPPKFTVTAAEHCETLSKVPITQDIMFKVRNFATKNDRNGFYKGKSWELGHVVSEYSRWKSAQYQVQAEEQEEQPKVTVGNRATQKFVLK